MFQSVQKSDSKQEKDNSSGKANAPRLDPSVYFHVPDLTYGAAEVAQLKEEEELQKKEEKTPVAQRMVEEEKEKAVQGKVVQGQEEEELQMKASSDSSKEGTSSSGTTAIMPEEVQAKMEGSFGTSFSDVNIHSNDNSATHMGALAYTQGNNVHFAPGQYNPGTSKGQELLGHELTHVVQQRQGRVQPVKQGKGMPVNDNPSLENEADVMGKKAAEGETVDIKQKGSFQRSIQKKEDDKLKVKNGQITFDAEGNDDEKSIYFTRKAHWPGGVSGVTIGRGYDLAHRGSKEQILKELKSVGIDNSKFEGAIGLSGEKAKDWLKSNKEKLPIITHKQQKELFAKTYESIEKDTKRLATKEDVTEAYGATDWDNLQTPIKEVLVDLRYRGDYTPSTRKFLQKHVANNDLKEFYKIMSDKSKWENVPKDRFDRRVNYLKGFVEGNNEKKEEKTESPTDGKGSNVYHYEVEKGKGNSQIAKIFGVTQAAIEEVNKDLYQKRGSKGYFFPRDKIIIPNPSKNIDKLSKTVEPNAQSGAEGSEASGLNLGNMAENSLWLANPFLMGTYKIGKALYNKYSSSEEKETTEKVSSDKQQDNGVYNKKARTDAIKFIKDNKYAYLKGHQDWSKGDKDGKKYNQILLVNKKNSENAGKHLRVYRNFDFKTRYYHLIGKDTLTDEQYTAELETMFQNKKDRAAKKGKTLKTHRTDTFCNIATTAIAEYYGATNLQYHEGKESNANAMYARLDSGFYNTDTHEYKNVNYKQAESYAKSGGFAIAVIKDKIGHIGTLKGGYGGDGKEVLGNLNIFQAGGNFGDMTYSQGFGNKEPKLYIWTKKSGGNKKSTENKTESEKKSVNSQNIPKASATTTSTPAITGNSSTSSDQYKYKVKAGKGNNQIAIMFGITQAAIEAANKELHQKRGGKGYFFPNDEIIIPSPTKNLDKLIGGAAPKDETIKEPTVAGLASDYKSGKLNIPDFARAIKPFASKKLAEVLSVFDELAWNEKDNFSFALANNSSESELTGFDRTLLKKMSSSLSSIYTLSVFENLKQKERVDKALKLQKSVPGKINTLMANKYLTPEQVKEVRDLIIQITDDEARKVYYSSLQSKVKYENQRDSIVKEGSKRVENKNGGICNLTSLAMVLQYLGISNPHPDMQYEDALEKVRQENNFSARTGKGWVQVAQKMGVEVEFILNRGNTEAKSKAWWKSNVGSKIQSGYGFMMSIKGHIVRLQNVTEEGLVVDDPYGRLDLQKRLDNNKKGGYKKYNKSEWGWSSEGAENEGEDNVWPWSTVEKYAMWWLASFKK